MIEIKKYTAEDKIRWNEFVKNALNATFLFDRNYMDYHSDRFSDTSLMIYKNNKLISLLPANKDEGCFHSHGGLSYGGLIINKKMGAQLMLDIFSALLDYLRSNNFKSIIYKPVPIYFHKKPCEYDLYALFRNNFELSRREISTVITIHGLKIPLNRRAGFKTAVANGVTFEESKDFEDFIKIANERLQEKYNTIAVHTADELHLLKSRFPNEIKFYGAYLNNKLIGGALLYLINNTLHAQYLYNNEEARKNRVLDFMIVKILQEEFSSFDLFDFGKSTEEGGRYLNEKLIKTKEEFGGTSICYDTYSLSL